MVDSTSVLRAVRRSATINQYVRNNAQRPVGALQNVLTHTTTASSGKCSHSSTPAHCFCAWSDGLGVVDSNHGCISSHVTPDFTVWAPADACRSSLCVHVLYRVSGNNQTCRILIRPLGG